MGLPLIIAITVATILALSTVGISVIGIIENIDALEPEHERECFPIVQSELLVNVKKFAWIDSFLSCCTSETRDDYCYCSFSIEFDRNETLIWPINNGTMGLADDSKIADFERHRHNEIKFIKVNIGEKAFHFKLRFNSDLIASVTICKDTKAPYEQRHLVDEDEKLTQWYIANYKDDMCGHITFQIIKEKKLKLRSCSILGLFWDINDSKPTE